MAEKNYWQGLMDQRASRRAVVVGGASLAGAAALLAACGGSSDSGSTGSSDLAVFTDTKEETPAKTGGQFKHFIQGDLPSLDPYKQTAASPSSVIGTFAMNRLVNFKTGPGVDPNKFDVKGDLAESWEISDGGLTYTFKLRQGVKWQNIAPVSGRTFDSDDVMASYKRFSGLSSGVGGTTASGAGAPAFGNSLKGVVASVEAPDKQTVVFKLTKPNAAFLNVLATYLFFWIYPKEVDVSYDPSKTPIGTGPWQMSNYVPSGRIEFAKNPEYYEKGLPYMDSFVTYFIPEPAQQIAQFQAGSVMVYTPTQFGDFQSLTSDLEGLRVLGSGILASTQGIGFLKDNPDSPFIKDARVRQAMSLALDRETVMESFNDIDKYKSIGLTRDYRLANFVPPNLEQYWIDPRGKEMGDSAQYFQFDVAKAKQLLSAAGYPNGFEYIHHYSANNATDLYQNAQPLMAQWFAAVGMKAKLTGEDYASVFNPHSWHGDGEGTANWTWQTFGDPGQQLEYLFGATSTRNQMGVNDPKYNSMYDAQQAELDTTKRRSQLVSLYQYLGQEMRHIPWGYGTINTFSLHQAQIRNNWAFRTSDSPTGVVGTNSKHFWLAS